MTDKPDINDEPGRHLQIPKRNLLLLSVGSAVVYLLLAWLIFYFFHKTELVSAFEHGFSLSNQLWTGAVAGGAGAAVVTLLIKRPPVAGVLDDFYIVRALKNTPLTKFDCVQLSLFAGTGEELLFRGAIQPLLGIWVTSVIFVGIHGYFKFQKPGHWVFGAMMFGLSMGLGYLFEYAGLAAAMTAHAVYDLIMLYLVADGSMSRSGQTP
ncbi:CPBP family intramembrane glutamic endopeptidase [Halalkalibaculum sp. DA3122]|uniref:CPBP family intramembrane glutamic endopeptidase n=1 Tax=Halalkalibaculum sp. DA3122 TaxID=3373607 RepID=UPI003754D10E